MILQTTVDGFWPADTSANILEVNESCCRVSGYSRDEILNLRIFDLDAVETPSDIAARIARIAAAGSETFETRHRRRDGSFFDVEISVTCMNVDGGRMICFSRDITDRKLAEAGLHANLRRNSELHGELQHRVKNSFAMICGMIDIASGAVESDRFRSILTELGSRVRSVSELYTLLYSDGSFTEVRLDEYCRRVASPIVGLAENIVLAEDLESITVPVKKAAPVGLIVTELITNAVKHAFPGGRRGTVTVGLKRSGAGIILEVRDDGAGLPPGFDLAATPGMGFNLVRALSDQIGGGEGTRCLVEFSPGE